MGTFGTTQDIFIILLMILFMGNQAADNGWGGSGNSLSNINEMVLIMILLFTLSGSNNNAGSGFSPCVRNGMNCRTT